MEKDRYVGDFVPPICYNTDPSEEKRSRGQRTQYAETLRGLAQRRLRVCGDDQICDMNAPKFFIFFLAERIFRNRFTVFFWKLHTKYTISTIYPKINTAGGADMI